MTDDQAVVIVDNDGNEHEFPAGMDPVKAAAIVRGGSPDSRLLHQINTQEGPSPAPDWKSKLAGALEPLAHPKSGADMAALMIPGEAGAHIMGKIIEPVAAAVGKYGGAALELGTSLLPDRARKAVGVLRQLNPATWNNPLTVAGREGRVTAASQAFNDQPLAVQMNSLPETASTTQGRIGMPPTQQASTPFHERPLYEQMMDLPGTPAPETTRYGQPPYRTQTPDAPAKPNYSAADVLKIKDLIRQGASQEMALKILQQAKQGVTSIP